MRPSVPTNTIAERAAEWAVMAEYGEMTLASRAELDIWLAADRRHRGAFLRARAGLYRAEDSVIGTSSVPAALAPPVPASDNDNREELLGQGYDERVPGPLRRGFARLSGKAFTFGAAFAASVAALVTLDVPMPSFGSNEVAATQRVMTLKDGSVATLGEDARIEIALSPEYRRIRLISGEATFDVAPHKSRPFVVQSGDVYAQATGTIYSVRRVGPTGSTVKVAEGSVLVWPGDERDQAVLLHAGGELTLKPGPRLPDPAPTRPAPVHLPPPEVAQFSFDHVPIASAVRRFNRVNSTRIEIADPEIGAVEIVGLFQADDPEQFAQAAAVVSGGIVEQERGKIVIKLK